MKFSKTLMASTVAAAAMIGSVFASTANAEVKASVGVANMYYWRGLDLGNGDPQVSGDLKFTESGFYAGIWGGSGDAAGGTEYDLYTGYGNTLGEFFKYDLSVWTYSYPSKTTTSIVEGELVKSDASVDPGDLSEAALTLGFGPISVSYLDNIAGGSGYWYATVSATIDKFTVLYGQHESLSGAHVDLSYAYNDNLSFKIGKVVDDEDGTVNDKAKFIVSYNLPIGE